MRKTHFKKLFAVALTGALALQAAFIPVMADEATESTDVLEEISDLSLEEVGDLGTVTINIGAKGSINFDGTELSDIQADLTLVTDTSTGAHCAAGSIGASGISVDFSEYMDSEKIMLKIPGVSKVLSYSYKSDPAGSYLSSIVGEDTLKVINNALQLMSASTSDPEGMAAFGEEIIAVFTEAASNLEFEAAPEKECSIGGEAVVCQGMQVTLPRDFIVATINKVFDCNLPTGITYGEYFDGVLSVSAQSDPSTPTSIKDYIASAFESMPAEFVCSVYMTEDGFPAEIDLTAEGSTLAIELRGPAGMNWTEIALTADGEELGVLSLNITDTGLQASLTVSGQEMAAFTFDASDMSFQITSAMLPFEISGQVVTNEDGSYTLVLNIGGLEITAGVSFGGTVAEPEGEVLDLAAMTEADFSSLASSLSSVFGSVSNAAA